VDLIDKLVFQSVLVSFTHLHFFLSVTITPTSCIWRHTYSSTQKSLWDISDWYQTFICNYIISIFENCSLYDEFVYWICQNNL